jgi:hypothetical protein
VGLGEELWMLLPLLLLLVLWPMWCHAVLLHVLRGL